MSEKQKVEVILSLPARGVWIEIYFRYSCVQSTTSLPARGVWIEILNLGRMLEMHLVAPRKGSVD